MEKLFDALMKSQWLLTERSLTYSECKFTCCIPSVYIILQIEWLLSVYWKITVGCWNLTEKSLNVCWKVAQRNVFWILND